MPSISGISRSRTQSGCEREWIQRIAAVGAACDLFWCTPWCETVSTSRESRLVNDQERAPCRNEGSAPCVGGGLTGGGTAAPGCRPLMCPPCLLLALPTLFSRPACRGAARPYYTACWFPPKTGCLVSRACDVDHRRRDADPSEHISEKDRGRPRSRSPCGPSGSPSDRSPKTHKRTLLARAASYGCKRNSLLKYLTREDARDTTDNREAALLIIHVHAGRTIPCPAVFYGPLPFLTPSCPHLTRTL